MKSEKQIIREIEELNGTLEHVGLPQLDPWLRYKHNELVIKPHKSDEDFIKLEADFVNMVMKRVTDSQSAKIDFKETIQGMYTDVGTEKITENQQSLHRVLKSLMQACFFIIEPPKQSESFKKIKAHLNDSYWNNKGVGFLFFSKVPTHIVELRSANTFQDMKDIANRALKKDPFFRHPDVKKLYESIRDATDEEHLADSLQQTASRSRSAL